MVGMSRLLPFFFLLSLPVCAQITNYPETSGGGATCGTPDCTVSGNLSVGGNATIGNTVPIPGGAPAGSVSASALYLKGVGAVLSACEDVGGSHLNLSVLPPYSTTSPGLICGITTGSYPKGYLTWSLGSMAAGTCQTNTFNLPNASPGDALIPIWPATINQALLLNMIITSPGIVTVSICNFSTGAITPGSSLSYSAMLIK